MTRPPLVVVGALLLSLLPTADALWGPGWYVSGPVVVGAAAAGYALGSLTSRMVATASVVVCAGLLTLANQLVDDTYYWLDDTVFFLVVVGGPAFAGAAVVARARQVRELTRLGVELEDQRSVELEAARLEEQNRVAEQVHRRISQRMGAIALRAEGARRAPAGGDMTALSDIESVARGALDELRETLGSLRRPDASVVEPKADRGSAAPSISLLDVVVVIGCGAAMGVETLVVDRAEGPPLANLAAMAAVASPLLWRRRRPILVTVLVGALGSATSHWLTGLSFLVTPLVLMTLTAYAVGAWTRGRWWIVGLVAQCVAISAVAVASGDFDGGGDGAMPIVLWTGAAVALGRVTAGWQERVHGIADALAELERGRGNAVRMAVARERQALASSLHDSVAHAMTVVCVQAGAAQRVPDRAGVDEALRTIAATARSGLTELRTGLGVLDGENGPLDRAGVATLAQDIGVAVEVRATGGLELRGPGSALALRVIRESLVNVARHAPEARAVVTFSSVGDVVRLEVDDDGAGAGARFAGGTGTGLSALADEVSAAGGAMEWGPRAPAGFRVVAEVPLVARRLEVTR